MGDEDGELQHEELVSERNETSDVKGTILVSTTAMSSEQNANLNNQSSLRHSLDHENESNPSGISVPSRMSQDDSTIPTNDIEYGKVDRVLLNVRYCSTGQ